MGFVPVKDKPGLVRDTRTNGIINIDEKGYNAYQKQKRISKLKAQEEKAKDERINNLENRLASLETKLDLILDKLSNNGNT